MSSQFAIVQLNISPVVEMTDVFNSRIHDFEKFTKDLMSSKFAMVQHEMRAGD